MKIVVITPFFAPSIGGSGQLLAEISSHLSRQDDLDVLTYSTDPEAASRHDAEQPYRITRVRPRPHRGASSLQTAWALFRICRRRRPDLVVCGAAYPTAVIAAIVGLVSRTPYAVFAHGEDVSFSPGQHLPRALCRVALSRAATLIANSCFSARRMQHVLGRCAEVNVVHPWIDAAPYSAVEQAQVLQLREQLALTDKRVMLTVARLEPRKGHDCVIAALPSIAESVPTVHYVIVGAGDPNALLGLAQRIGVSDRVTFSGSVPKEDLPLYYRLCDVFIMTSRPDPATDFVDGFGMVYLEAAAAGRASIAGDLGGCAEAVIDGETGVLVDPRLPELIAASAVELLNDPDRATAMGEIGMQRVRERHSPIGQLEEIERCLKLALK